MAEKCMEMDEWKKEPQASGWLEMQGQMSLLCVYNEKNESSDDSGSDISISPTEFKVK